MGECLIKNTVNKLLVILCDNRILYKKVIIVGKNADITFSTFHQALKASTLFEKLNIQHYFYRKNFHNPRKIYIIRLPESIKPYSTYLVDKNWLVDLSKELGTIFLKMFDKAYNYGIESLDVDEIRSIDEDRIFIEECIVEETFKKLTLFEIIDYFYKANSEPSDFFTSDNIEEEKNQYSHFIQLLFSGLNFTTAFLTSFIDN